MPRVISATDDDLLAPASPANRPPVRSGLRLSTWVPVVAPARVGLANPFLERVQTVALSHAHRSPAAVGAGLAKFHVFCDSFNIPEGERVPTSASILHSFALWASCDLSAFDYGEGRRRATSG